MYAQTRKNNMVHRKKLKLYGPFVQRKRIGKDLARKVEKCTFLYKKYFKKCCDYRAKFKLELKKCKYQYPTNGQATKNCRRNIRLKYP